MRAAFALLSCSAALGGCGGVDRLALDGEYSFDPSTIYLASFEQVETTREDVDDFACLSGSPLMCDIVSISLVECWCPY